MRAHRRARYRVGKSRWIGEGLEHAAARLGLAMGSKALDVPTALEVVPHW